MLKLQVNTDNSRPVSLYEFMWSAILHNMHNTKRSFQTADLILKNKSLIMGIFKIFQISSFSSQIERFFLLMFRFYLREMHLGECLNTG